MTLSRQITYQVGVDILGFPIYVQHKIYEGASKNADSKYFKNTKNWIKVWLVVTEKIFKQH